MRLDDNDNTFHIRDFDNEEEAEAKAKEYQDKGHHQTYWVEEKSVKKNC